MDSTMQDVQPGEHCDQSFQKKLQSRAVILRSCLRGIRRPTFSMPAGYRSEKKKSASSTSSEKSNIMKASRMERFKMALPERPRFSLPSSSKLNNFDCPKFKIKHPNFHLLNSFNRTFKGAPHSQKKEQELSTETAYGSRKNILNFSTYPRIFGKKSRNCEAEYTTSSPKESRAQSAESATFPRTEKMLENRWVEGFRDPRLPDEFVDHEVDIERYRPWRRPFLEDPRSSLRIMGSESFEEYAKASTESAQEKVNHPERIQYADHEDDSGETSDRRASRSNDQTEKDESSDKDMTPHSKLNMNQARNQETGNFELLRGIENLRSSNQVEDAEKIEEVKGEGFLISEREDCFGNGGTFSPMDPRPFDIGKISSDEHSPVRSYGELQSGGSYCLRRNRSGIEERDSDEFSLSDRDISQDNMSTERFVISDIRETLRATPVGLVAYEDVTLMPPQRPSRTKSLREGRSGSSQLYGQSPPAKPKRERVSRSDVHSGVESLVSIPDAAHIVIYRAETTSSKRSQAENLDHIVIVKPARRKKGTSSYSVSQSITESSIDISPCIFNEKILPVVPRRKRRIQIPYGNESDLHHDHFINSGCAGENDWDIAKNSSRRKHLSTLLPTLPLSPAPIGREIMENIALRLEQEIFELPPVPSERCSRSATASIITNADRSKHGAESISGIGYNEDDTSQDASREQSAGYAVIEKLEEPSKTLLPRSRKREFAKTPRLFTPKRPQKATLGQAREIISYDTETSLRRSSDEISKFTKIDPDGEHEKLRSGEVLSRMQNRPLPAPPRPPRLFQLNKESGDYHGPGFSHSENEVVASTQTDPLPDDIVIEDGITQAKLMMAPSRYCSQALISTERVPTPTLPPISLVTPPPIMQSSEDSKILGGWKFSNVVEQNIREGDQERYKKKEGNDQRNPRDILQVSDSDESLRIDSLEVGDLRVHQLSVSQMKAYKIVASEIDAIVVSASELSKKECTPMSEVTPSFMQQSYALGSQLETVAKDQERPTPRTQNACTVIDEPKIGMIIPSNVTTQDSNPTSAIRKVQCGRETGSGTLNNSPVPIPRVGDLKLGVELKTDLGCTTLASESPSCESSEDQDERRHRKSKSRSRSSSLSRGRRQTASPVKYLPPVISVTPDIPDTFMNHTILPGTPLQRAIISYSEEIEQSQPPQNNSHTLSRATWTTQLPDQSFRIASPTTRRVAKEPSITETIGLLLKAVQIVGTRAMRHFVDPVLSKVAKEEASDKNERAEFVLCALLLIVAGLLIMFLGSPRIVTHHHHWDYFNPPQ